MSKCSEPKSTNKIQTAQIELEQVQDITPHNKALYEAGKKLLVDSIEVGREFCKFMITTALAAIPAYMGLLKFVLPKDYSLQSHDEISFLAAPILFLASSVLFAIGYFPRRSTLSLDLPDDIERDRSKTITRRQRCAIGAFSIFCIGIMYGVWVLITRLPKWNF